MRLDAQEHAERGAVAPLRRVDDVDRKIIEALQHNGRESFRGIAARVGVSEATVRARYGRLTSEGILQVVGVTNPLGLGFDQALVGIKTSGAPSTVADEISQLARGGLRRRHRRAVRRRRRGRRLRPRRAARADEPDPRARRRRLDRDLSLPRNVETALRLGGAWRQLIFGSSRTTISGSTSPAWAGTSRRSSSAATAATSRTTRATATSTRSPGSSPSTSATALATRSGRPRTSR